MNDFLMLRYRALINKVLAYIFATARSSISLSSVVDAITAKVICSAASYHHDGALHADGDTQESEHIRMLSGTRFVSKQRVDKELLTNVLMVAMLNYVYSDAAARISRTQRLFATLEDGLDSDAMARNAPAIRSSGTSPCLPDCGDVKIAVANSSSGKILRMLLSQCSGYTLGTNFVAGLIKSLQTTAGTKSSNAIKSMCQSVLVDMYAKSKTASAIQSSGRAGKCSEISSPVVAKTNVSCGEFNFVSLFACDARMASALRSSSRSLSRLITQFVCDTQQTTCALLYGVSELTAKAFAWRALSQKFYINSRIADLIGTVRFDNQYVAGVKCCAKDSVDAQSSVVEATAVISASASDLYPASVAGAYTKSAWKYPVYSADTLNLYIPRSRLVVPDGNNIKIE